MRIIGLFCSMFSAAFRDVVQQKVTVDQDQPARSEQQLQPIRCVGDPTEIYLA